MSEEKSAYNAAEHMMNLKGKDYLPVAARIVWLRRDHPDAIIRTALVEWDKAEGFAMYRAEVTLPSGGHAEATATQRKQQFPDYVEKCETKASGNRIAYNDPRHTTEYAPQQALRAEIAARQADTPPAPAPVTWTQLWPEAKKRGYQDRAALDALMAPEKIDENALWKVLARLREVGQPAAAPASIAG
jgi:hypothetical protein